MGLFGRNKYDQPDTRAKTKVTVPHNGFGKIDRFIIGCCTFGLSELALHSCEKEIAQHLDRQHPYLKHKVKFVYPRRFILLPDFHPHREFLIPIKHEDNQNR